MSFELQRTTQCAKCPWRTDVDPHEIPDGYCEVKHGNLQSTIAKPGDVSAIGRGEIHVMACHETHEAHCVGWLANQLGPGNNIALRLHMLKCTNVGDIHLIGEQHERFQDTLPMKKKTSPEPEKIERRGGAGRGAGRLPVLNPNPIKNNGVGLRLSQWSRLDEMRGDLARGPFIAKRLKLDDPPKDGEVPQIADVPVREEPKAGDLKKSFGIGMTETQWQRFDTLRGPLSRGAYLAKRLKLDTPAKADV